jgi:hypothetical protein
MEKKASAIQNTAVLRLRRETLSWLDDPKLRVVGGGVRIWKPVGFADDTTPTDDNFGY